MKSLCLLLGAILLTTMPLAIEPLAAEQVTFNARTARSGPWSAAETWEASRLPQSGDFVQVRAGHVVTYDVDSSAALRMIHVAGTLSFAHDKSTLLVVGLIRIEPGETSTEDGFDGQAEFSAHDAGGSTPALEIGTPDSPIPAEVKATIRLKHFPGTSEETLPAIIVCGGRWDVHGAPLVRTWVKLGAPAMPGDSQIIPAEEMKDWRAGDRIIITSGEAQGPESGHSFQKKPFGRQKPVGTEERTIAAGGAQTAGAVIRLDRAARPAALRRRPHALRGRQSVTKCRHRISRPCRGPGSYNVSPRLIGRHQLCGVSSSGKGRRAWQIRDSFSPGP